MGGSTLILLAVLVLINTSHQYIVRKIFKNTSMETRYSGEVADGEENVYHFTLPNSMLKNSVSNIYCQNQRAWFDSFFASSEQFKITNSKRAPLFAQIC